MRDDTPYFKAKNASGDNVEILPDNIVTPRTSRNAPPEKPPPRIIKFRSSHSTWNRAGMLSCDVVQVQLLDAEEL